MTGSNPEEEPEDTASDIQEELAELKSANQALRERVEQLEEQEGDGQPKAEEDDTVPVSRRGVLSVAGLLGLGGIAASQPASAAVEQHNHLGEVWEGDPGGNEGLKLRTTGSQQYTLFAQNDIDGGQAIFGRSTSNSGFTKALEGRASSPDGRGLLGYNDATSGAAIGVEGRTDSTGTGKAVYGHALAGSGTPRGVEGQTDSPDGFGVLGFASAGSGSPKAVAGYVQSSSGYGLYTPDNANVGGTLEIGGDLQVTGTKNFVQAVSTDVGEKQVTYTAIEAGNVRTETSDLVEMTDGQVTIDLPDHFGMVTSSEKPLTVQVTPYATERVHPQVTERSINHIKVEDFGDGTDEYTFAYTVKGIREGFEDQEIVAED